MTKAKAKTKTKKAPLAEIPVIEAPATVVESSPNPKEKQTAEIEAKTVIVKGQQDTSHMWESTQRLIALSWTFGTLIVLTAIGTGLTGAHFPSEMAVLTGVIVQSYFQRTNTHKLGGVEEGKSASER